MSSIECERVFLVKKLPPDVNNSKNITIQIGDFSLGNNFDILKIRRKGDDYEMIKKEFVSATERKEHCIPLTRQEFDLLYPVAVRKHTKRRFFYPLGDHMCEIDFYLEDMLGYARVEVEFANLDEMRKFNAPDWFGEEITTLNHEIHECLGTINFQVMVDRFNKKGIVLTPITQP